LLRFVVAPGGAVVPDIAGQLPGNALYLCGKRAIVAQAVAMEAFSTLAANATATAELPDKVEALLRTSCLSLIAMARKCGLVISGYEKVRAVQAAKQASLLLRAGDSAFATRHSAPSTAQALPVVTLFSSAELSAIIGQQHVVHMALKPGKLTAKLHMAIKRLTYYTKE
jgi:predicted RNA-binding protein YlxR (DUF448 family)